MYSHKEVSRTKRFTGKFYQKFKEELRQILYKLVHKKRGRRNTSQLILQSHQTLQSQMVLQKNKIIDNPSTTHTGGARE